MQYKPFIFAQKGGQIREAYDLNEINSVVIESQWMTKSSLFIDDEFVDLETSLGGCGYNRSGRYWIR